MYSLADFQTLQEWEWILQRVNEYRCKDCEGDEEVIIYAENFMNNFGMGGIAASPEFIEKMSVS